MDLGITKTDRSIYGVLDWIGDIGGFKEGLGWFTIFTLFFF